MTTTLESKGSSSYSAAQVDDPDGVKTSFATQASEHALTATDYNGALVYSSGTKWLKNLPRTVTITRSNAVGSYTTDDIVLTGTYRGAAITESLTPADADGNDIIRGSKLFDVPPAITIPAQVDTGGAFTIGSGDIGAPQGGLFNAISLHAAGDLNVQYGQSTDAQDTIPISAGEVGELKPCRASRVLTDPALTAPTDVGLTVWYG